MDRQEYDTLSRKVNIALQRGDRITPDGEVYDKNGILVEVLYIPEGAAITFTGSTRIIC